LYLQKYQNYEIMMLLKFFSNRPKNAKEQLEKLINMLLLVANTLVIEPNSIEFIIVNSFKFDYDTDNESVTIVIHSEHKTIKLLQDYFEAFWSTYQIKNIKGYLHVLLALSTSLEKLVRNDKAERDVINLVKDGISILVELECNAFEVLKQLLTPTDREDLNLMLMGILAFLQKGAKGTIVLEELDLESFTTEKGQRPILDIDLFDEDSEYSLISVAERIQRMQSRLVMCIVDLFENYLQAHTQISLITPNFLITFQYTIAGVKEIWEKLQRL